MNGYGKAILQALMVVVILVIVVVGISLFTNPTSHEDIETRLINLEEIGTRNTCLILLPELTPEGIAACG